MKTLTLATFNVREFTKPHKQQQLIRDVTRYRMMDVCVIQETKVQHLSDTSSDNHRVIFETEPLHYGNGFIVSPQLKTMFAGNGMCQIELVFYKSSYPTPKSAHTTSKKHLQHSRTV